MRTSTKIKRKLRKEWPDAQFKVRKETSSLHKAFDVYTDLIIEYDHERFRELDQKLSRNGLKGEDLKEFRHLEKIIDHNRRVKKKIKNDLLADFWHIDRDQRSGEILSGGNTYLNVKKWEKTQYLS